MMTGVRIILMLCVCDLHRMINVFVYCIKKMGGVASARNLGLDQCKGDFITFVDADDYVDCCLIERLLDALVHFDADFVNCGFASVDTDGVIIKKYCSANEVCIDGIGALKIHFFELDYNISFARVTNGLFKSSIFDGNLRFRKNIIFEDLDIMPSILLKCTKVVILNYCGYFYVQHAASLMHDKTKSLKNYLSDLDIYQKHISLLEHADLLELRDAAIYRLLNRIMAADLNGKSSDYKSESLKLFKYYRSILINKHRRKYLQYLFYEKMRCFYKVLYRLKNFLKS